MKLYTKEMFLTAAEKCEVSMIDAKHIMQYIDEYVTPIELPSDEEVNEEAYNYAEKYCIRAPQIAALIHGAIWMRNKIQGGDQ